MATKRRIVSADFENGAALFQLYGPPNGEGKQSVADQIEFAASEINASLRDTLALVGVHAISQNAYNRLDDPSPETVKDAISKVLSAVRDGSWRPGRVFEAGEPDDIVLAIAEATGQPVHIVQRHIDEDVQKNALGEPIYNKKGQALRLYTKRMLDSIALDPKVAPIMARLARERATKLADQAKKLAREGATTGGLDAFMS